MGLFDINSAQIETVTYKSMMRYGTKFWEDFIRPCYWNTSAPSPHNFKVEEGELIYTADKQHVTCTFKYPYPLSECLPGVSRISFPNSNIKIQFAHQSSPLNGKTFVEGIRCRQLSIINRSIYNIDLSADSICLHDICSLSNVYLNSPHIIINVNGWFEFIEDVKLGEECEMTIMTESMEGLIRKFPRSEIILNAINNAYQCRSYMHLPLDDIKHIIRLLPSPSKLLNMRLDKAKIINIIFYDSMRIQYTKKENGNWDVSVKYAY